MQIRIENVEDPNHSVVVEVRDIMDAHALARMIKHGFEVSKRTVFRPDGAADDGIDPTSPPLAEPAKIKPTRERKPRTMPAIPDEHRAAILRELAGDRMNGATLVGDLGHGQRMPQAQIKRTLAAMVADGTLTIDKRGRGGTWYAVAKPAGAV